MGKYALSLRIYTSSNFDYRSDTFLNPNSNIPDIVPIVQWDKRN